MKKICASLILLFFILFDSYAQPGMQGMRMSSFGGTISGMENPALLANVRNRWDVNLMNMNYSLENSAIRINWRDFTQGQSFTFDANSLANVQDFSLKNIIEIQGPSVMFNVKNKLALGFSTRVRSFIQINSLDLSLAQPFFENRPFDIATDGKIEEPYMNINMQTFTDFGISGAYKVLRLKKHNLFVGATARIYRGVFAFDFTGRNIDLDLNQAANDSILNLDADLALRASVPVDADFLNNGSGLAGFTNPSVILSSLVEKAAGNGFGFDVGAVYEGQLLNKKLRAGLSITDIGNVKYNNGTQYGASFVANNVIINKDSIQDYPSGGYDSIKAYAANYGVLIDTSINGTTFTQSLPTRINLFADMQIAKGFYLSMMTAFDATAEGKPRSNYSTYVSFIPRFQSKRIEAWVPITYNAFSSQAQVGVGARISAFYFGTNNITDIIQGEVQGFNFYLGARVSSLRSKKKNDKNKGDKEG